ncbi:unnamed protein product [Brugia pahangi]|uniref:Delta-like protein n=1 Tax=Brugia pahangi TaxID=6280 RepID=A0A0N4T5G5_BRUPA|nr:unnamed protein product [Brugia pahangi]
MSHNGFQRESIPSGKTWTEETLVGTNGFRMRIAYRITCANDYYGPRCLTFCQPMSSTVGHFQCTSNGSLACSPGWEGSSCDIGSFHNYPCEIMKKSSFIIVLMQITTNCTTANL